MTSTLGLSLGFTKDYLAKRHLLSNKINLLAQAPTMQKVMLPHA